MNDTFTDHRTPEELQASYPRMTMWTQGETDTARFNWLSAWTCYRGSGFLGCASTYGKETAILCSEVNCRRHNPPFPFASLRDRLRCFKLPRA